MKTFWIILIIVVLFVIGSASALNYIGNKTSGSKKNNNENKQDS
ncbi:MAG TPA: hypothetical protein VIQ03_02040 [Gammaproteobacteria bacterium]